FLYNPDSTLFDTPHTVRLVGPDGAREVSITTRSGAGKRILGTIDGVTTPEQARALMDLRIVVPRDSLPGLDDDEYYDWQLEGAEVFVDGEPRGRLLRVHHPGEVDVFEIDTGTAEPTFVPSTAEFVLDINVEAPSVTLHPTALGEEPDAL
ncbi:MAG: ribosome maturation factor RimM, partial [Myxococcota bacterium]